MWVGYRIDPSKNMYRWYHVDIAPDLWGEWAVWTAWGRLGQRGRLRVLPVGTFAEAQAVADRIITKKKQRGYRHPGWCH
ncbi:MAG: WGR domain-containing protein [Actinomycetia bacterium]|nr:WGR domain-containing protein [Actinomycetes bacterium]